MNTLPNHTARRALRQGLLLASLSGGALLLASANTACGLTASQVVSAIVTIAQATCQVASEASNDPAWVNFTCSVVDATGTPRTILVKVPTAQVQAFVIANPPPAPADAGTGPTLRR